MDDLISEFITETSESLEVLDSELISLEENPNDTEILGNIFRLVHTIKGTCGFLGLPRLEAVAHAGENILGKFRDGDIIVNEDGVSLIFASLDCVRDLLEHLEENGEEPEGDDSELIKRLNIYADTGGNAGAAAATPEPEPEPEPEPVNVADMEDPGTDDATEAELQAAFDAADSLVDAEDPGTDDATEEELEAAFAAAEAQVDMGDAKEAAAAAAADASKDAGGDSGSAAPVATEAPKPKEAPKPAPKPDVKAQAVKKGMAAKKPDAAAAASNANQTIRVNVSVLEGLMSMVGELVLTRNQLAQMVRSSANEEFKGPLQRLSHITSELQEGVMKTRMQPIGNAWSKFPRLIRDLSSELDKKINLKMIGEDTELDRQLLEKIKDPLTHMVRNSCDHGLETKAERAETTKPEAGTVTLHAYHEGGHIIVDIIDDGKGINIDRVTEKILENGLATLEELEEMSERQIAQFIFKAGFSTAAAVTAVSGRGVGMDVVRTNIESIGGTVELDSVTGKGSTFHIKIPLTLAIVSVLLVKVKEERFAIPQINVIELVRVGKDSDLSVEKINDSPVLRLRDKLLPLIRISSVLGLDEDACDGADGLEADTECTQETLEQSDFVVVCRVGPSEYGLVVDEVFDTEEIVVKPVSELLADIPVYSGNTVLGDGNVIMILDPNGVIKAANSENAIVADGSEDSEKDGAMSKLVSFLLFSNGSDTPKAVPLELVSRLEEIDVETIEYSSDRPVVQYRGGLMRLATIDGMELPEKGKCEVIVFNYDGQTAGLVVSEIIDIINSEPAVKLGSNKDLYMGSLVMGDKTTDLLDVGRFLSDVLDIAAEIEGYDMEDLADKKILFVEDSMFFRNLTVPFLSSAGYRVTAVPSAEDALDILERMTFDAIITDIEMPGLNGFELTTAIRALPDKAVANLPIVAFTSTMDANFGGKMHECGLNDGVLKTDRERLISVVADYLISEDA